jgi:hypothetical protein
VRYTRPEASA